MKQQIKNAVSRFIPRGIKDSIIRKKKEQVFFSGYEAFNKTGNTPESAYQAMIDLYCLTNGAFSEKMHSKFASGNPPKSQKGIADSVIGSFNTEEMTRLNDTLVQEGYVDFNRKIPQEMVRAIYDFALKTPALIAPKYDQPIIYNPAQPLSEIYRFKAVDLVNNKDIQSLIMDPALINIARNYLNCEPIFDFPAMWWSTAFLKEASSEAAQLYHFDMDRVKWLKIFIYLNDVSPENGPHCYIKGSHQIGTKPAELLKRGYARIPDEDLKKYYKASDFISLSANAGTIFAGDTKCWHKGTPLQKGDRLVLEFEYTSSLFGANYPKHEITHPSKEFAQFCKENKTYASNFQFKS
jgi:Phytanoyl-CoA dioxygenase (PhyH)